MKIYILPVNKEFQPDSQPFRYPKHNADYGVEQDFFEYLKKNPFLLTASPSKADFHYLPIFWTRWHLSHDYGKNGKSILQKHIVKLIIDYKKTFTVCQYDDGPMVNLNDAIIFLSSRKSNVGLDIPLLSAPHKLPFFKPEKKYLASFIGRINTHPLRGKMHEHLINKPNVLIFDGNQSTNFFVKNTMSSYVCLAPRGYGGSSFRIYEAMQLGVVPYIISEIDTRPFKKFLYWDNVSFYSKTEKDILTTIENLNKNDLIKMGIESQKFYNNYISYGNWCNFLLKELETNYL